MDAFVIKPSRRCPVEKANFLSRFCFWWMRDIFVTGAHKDLEMDDMYYPLKSEESERVTDKLERAWNRELEKLKTVEYSPGAKKKKPSESAEPSLCRAIFLVFWWDYFKAGLKCLIMSAGLKSIQPLFQKGIISHFSGSGAEKVVSEDLALYYAAGLILTTLSIVWFNYHSTLECQQVAMRIRVASSALVYKKILRLSRSSLNHTTPGQIVNLLSNDVSRFDIAAPLLNQLWIMPIQVCITGPLMYMIIGPVAFVGLATLLLLIVPVQFVMNGYSKRLRRCIATFTDRRIQLMGELINGIQVVKMYAWEIPFAKIVSNTRFTEMGAIRTTSYLKSFTLSIMIFSDKLNLFLTLLTYVLLGNTLTADVTFTISMYFTTLQISTAFLFPQAVLQAGEAAVSIKRLQDFLMLEEVIMDKSIKEEIKKGHDNPLYESESGTIVNRSMENLPGIKEMSENDDESLTQTEEISRTDTVYMEMQRVSANWENGKLPPTLCDVTFKIYGGELCALVGQVGSGKTSLLNVILRELPIGSGSLYIRQKYDTDLEEFAQRRGYVTDNPELVVSYTSQDPWLFNGTVRDNILFGQPWDQTRYHEVTRACALWRDMRQWPQADLTIVGERGITLSGGQKARVNLARAVYKTADIYLLDDPLSAVDTRVGRHLFKKCINGFLKGKTRILVTHQLQYLKSVDTIVVLDHGLVRAQGTFEDLSKSSADFLSLLNKLKKIEEDKENKSSEAGNETKIEETGLEQSHLTRWDSVASIDSLNISLDWADASDVSSGGNSQLSEVVTKGTMSWSIWRRYFGAGGSLLSIIILITIIITGQISLTGTDFWISYWTNLEAVRSSLTDPTTDVTTEEYRSYANNTIFSYFSILGDDGLLPTGSAINIYTFLVLCCIFFNLTRTFTFMAVCMRASEKLHNFMFDAILRATMRFFNTNPSGRVLNRFSKDVGTMDELLPRVLIDANRLLLLMAGALLTIIIVNPWMVLPMIALLFTFSWATKYYLKTAYGIKRLEGICKSPIFSQVNATLQGLATIRSNGPAISQMLQRQFDFYQDVHSGTWYLSYAASVTFGFWLDICACIFVACLCFTMILVDNGDTFGGTVGLVISQSLSLTGMLQICVKQCAESCTYMTAIERILQYADLKSEGSRLSDDPPGPNWPSKGRLSMKNVYLSYTDENLPVLKDLNLTIEPGWKVGIVGRTGAGKSSLISAIFRLENEGLDGEIKIDGRDTATLGLEELRSRISVIPQQSVLFSGTLRHNIDPFDCYEDAALWDALREVELNDLSLDHPVSEGGSNFSVGQRQLICLARAILKNNRILVLDEATANIDARTDALIQKTLKTKFARHTVITVAHRLITVIENDRILLMDGGRVAEFGCPYELLCGNPDGPFAEMVRQAGSAVSENLIRLAESACLEVLPHHSLDLARTNSEENPPSAVSEE